MRYRSKWGFKEIYGENNLLQTHPKKNKEKKTENKEIFKVFSGHKF